MNITSRKYYTAMHNIHVRIHKKTQTFWCTNFRKTFDMKMIFKLSLPSWWKCVLNASTLVLGTTLPFGQTVLWLQKAYTREKEKFPLNLSSVPNQRKQNYNTFRVILVFRCYVAHILTLKVILKRACKLSFSWNNFYIVSREICSQKLLVVCLYTMYTH